MYFCTGVRVVNVPLMFFGIFQARCRIRSVDHRSAGGGADRLLDAKWTDNFNCMVESQRTARSSFLKTHSLANDVVQQQIRVRIRRSDSQSRSHDLFLLFYFQKKTVLYEFTGFVWVLLILLACAWKSTSYCSTVTVHLVLPFCDLRSFAAAKAKCHSNPSFLYHYQFSHPQRSQLVVVFKHTSPYSMVHGTFKATCLHFACPRPLRTLMWANRADLHSIFLRLIT